MRTAQSAKHTCHLAHNVGRFTSWNLVRRCVAFATLEHKRTETETRCWQLKLKQPVQRTPSVCHCHTRFPFRFRFPFPPCPLRVSYQLAPRATHTHTHFRYVACCHCQRWPMFFTRFACRSPQTWMIVSSDIVTYALALQGRLTWEIKILLAVYSFTNTLFFICFFRLNFYFRKIRIFLRNNRTTITLCTQYFLDFNINVNVLSE